MLWQNVRGAQAVIHPSSPPMIVNQPDCPETIDQASSPEPEWELGPISGRNFFITYRDSQDYVSERQVVCRKLELRNQQLYLRAFCLACMEPRQFRADRIVSIIDTATGEVHEPGIDLLRTFSPDLISLSPFRYGLSVQAYADFNAALNVLAFMARCDGKWHDLEEEATDNFATSYWIRREFTSELDLVEVRRHLRRLTPDPETFWLSLKRCAESRVIAQIIQRHIAALIDADGIHHPEELQWGLQIDTFLRSD